MSHLCTAGSPGGASVAALNKERGSRSVSYVSAEDSGRWDVRGSLRALGGGGALTDRAGVSAG